MTGDEPVLRRAVAVTVVLDGCRNHRAQPTDQSRRREWRRRPPEREQHVGTVDDQARDALEDAAVVNHWGAPGVPSVLRRGPRAVSYTHLTLPTKRIV